VVEPDYFQFYARREGAEFPSGAMAAAYRNRLWTNGHFVVISTLRKFGTTPITLDVLATEPAPPGGAWQHVAEVSLNAGGALEVLSWPGDQEPRSRHEIPARAVRLRVHWGGLVAGQFEGMDDEGQSPEHLALQIWPSPIAPFGLLREWDSWPR
jgi:hypothetical protein